MSTIPRNQIEQGREDESSSLHSSNVPSRRYNIDNIDLDDSPMKSFPSHFQAGSIIDDVTFQRVLTEVMNKETQKEQQQDHDLNEQSDYDDNDMITDTNANLFNERQFDEELERDLQNLSQIIQMNQPINDNLASGIIHQLNEVLRTTTMPVNQMTTDDGDNNDQSNMASHLTEHDIPMIYYGHLNRQNIAQQFQFNLQPTPTVPNDRFNAMSFAITSWTDVSKDLVMQSIKDDFGLDKIQYICISEEIGEVSHRRHLHIQVIFTSKINRRKPFVDDVTQTHCNYQVTGNDIAWNAYIKKGGNYNEYGSFRSIRQHSDQIQQLLSASSTSAPMISTRAMTARAQTEQRQQQNKEMARHVLKLAETNVHQAMEYIRQIMPDKFLAHSSWYLSTFNYINGRKQQHLRETGEVDKDNIWPRSFQQCTAALKEVVNRWIRHHFSRTKRAKCLVLIGPTGTGKTSFALSLPGYVNYFKGRWNLDSWHDYARYSVYDDIAWDDFSKLNYPNKKDLLTQNGKINATDKYRRTVEINVRQPAIVLLNPEDTGSLTREPITLEEHQLAQYWKKRATVYIMGPNEYFYQRPRQTTGSTQNQSSSNSSTANDEQRLGDPDEFETMLRRWEAKQ
ncbi:unnamed protein product [Adineta steineri]|uniref:Replication-associated protein n=1 Tax=Adineta steineri TaxID=433720 RepID=A0A815HVV7_9BILA|nr:unnamed protein product [Adineta steineri]CAF1431430.1 unnamed protein product [Adineta steineri]CAF3864514.1 unnamed protein product [Adineta steineri]CAF4206256.1 unnamed protein product [Adineta steineri]